MILSLSTYETSLLMSFQLVHTLNLGILSGIINHQLKKLFNNIVPIQGPATNDLPSLLALIAGKNGIAFVPTSVCHFLPKDVKLIRLELEQSGWDISIAWNTKFENNNRDLFLKMVKDII